MLEPLEQAVGAVDVAAERLHGLGRVAQRVVADGAHLLVRHERHLPRKRIFAAKRKVVRGGAIRKAAAERGREINKRREVDMKAVEKLLELARRCR